MKKILKFKHDNNEIIINSNQIFHHFNIHLPMQLFVQKENASKKISRFFWFQVHHLLKLVDYFRAKIMVKKVEIFVELMRNSLDNDTFCSLSIKWFPSSRCSSSFIFILIFTILIIINLFFRLLSFSNFLIQSY